MDRNTGVAWRGTWRVPVTKISSRRNLLRAISTAAAASAAGLLLGESAVAEPEVPRLATIANTEEFLLPGPEGRTFRIQVSHPNPDDPSLSLPIKGRKPVPVYVLDGGGTFGLFSTLTRYMQWGGELPPCLVVGIGYENEQEAYDGDYRRYDLTPPDPKWAGWPGDEETPEQVGGGPALREFLTDTLCPLIEKRFDVDSSDSVLYGHSVGGLFALNTMLETPGAFRNILALSPSIWFADRRFLKAFEERLENSFSFPGAVAVYVGEREERIAGASAKMTSNVLDLGRLVAQHRSRFGRAAVRVLPNESHHTILAPAIASGLQFLLSPEKKRAETY
jgi:predicted alpha/beta superfamily hydrolase